MDDIKIFSTNVRGLGELKKRRGVLHYLRNLNVNVIFLQDTHITEDKISYFNNLWNGNLFKYGGYGAPPAIFIYIFQMA